MGNKLESVMEYLLSGVEAEKENVPIDQTGQMEHIRNTFQFSEDQIMEFFRFYRQMDQQGTGFINLDNLFEFVGEELNSMVSPYLERFFILIKKQHIDKITFCEWLPAVATFCLYNEDQIQKFVFNMLDTNQDSFISKKDLIEFLSAEKFKQRIFPTNLLKAVENLQIERPDRIKDEEFRRNQQKIPFMCFPAFRLQDELQYNIMGKAFWKKQHLAIQKVCEKELLDKQAVLIQNNQDEQRTIKLKKKQLTFDEKIKFPVPPVSIHHLSLRKHLRHRKPSDSLYEIPKVFQKFRIFQQPIKRNNSELYFKKPFLYEDKKLEENKQCLKSKKRSRSKNTPKKHNFKSIRLDEEQQLIN